MKTFEAINGRHVWQQANNHRENGPHDPKSIMPCSHTANAFLKMKMKSESDFGKSSDMIAWEQTKKVGENVKDGIAKSIELAPLVMPRDYYADEGDYDGVGKVAENVVTPITWNDIKNTADAVFEPAKVYPGVHSGMNQVYDSGLSELEHALCDVFAGGTKTTENSKPFSDEEAIDSGLLEPQHTLYDAFADGPDGPHLENDKKLPDMDEKVFDSGLLEPQHTLYAAFADGPDGSHLENDKKFPDMDEKVFDSGLLEPQHTLYAAFADGPDGSHLENDKKFPDMDEKVFDSGLLEPQHTLYDAFADGMPIEDSKAFPGVKNIPESVEKDEKKFDISDEDLESTGSALSDIALPSEEKMESVKRQLDEIYLSQQNMVEATRDLDKILNSDEEKCNISKEQTSDEDLTSTSSSDKNSPDISENTFQKMESVKRDLNKILDSVKKKSKVSKEKGNDNKSANEPKEVNVPGITKSVKEIKQMCRSASEKLAEFLE